MCSLFFRDCEDGLVADFWSNTAALFSLPGKVRSHDASPNTSAFGWDLLSTR